MNYLHGYVYMFQHKKKRFLKTNKQGGKHKGSTQHSSHIESMIKWTP